MITYEEFNNRCHGDWGLIPVRYTIGEVSFKRGMCHVTDLNTEGDFGYMPIKHVVKGVELNKMTVSNPAKLKTWGGFGKAELISFSDFDTKNRSNKENAKVIVTIDTVNFSNSMCNVTLADPINISKFKKDTLSIESIARAVISGDCYVYNAKLLVNWYGFMY